jgi:integrase/recombinase XerD
MEAKGRLSEEIAWFLDHLVVERAASPHTVEAYRRDLEQARSFFEGLGVGEARDLTTAHLLQYESSLTVGLARTSAQRKMSALRSFLKFLKRRRLGPEAELPSVPGARTAKRIPKALSQDVLERILAVPDLAKPSGIRDRMLLELIYGAGLRVSEAVALRTDQVDLDGGALRVTGKRGKTRWVPLPDGTVVWIRRYLRDARPHLARSASPLLVLSDRGKPLLRQTVYAKLAQASLRAGLPEPIGPHVLRHTYAVHLLKGGADLRAVQELLGHESVATTQIYTQLDNEEVKRRYREAHPRA